MNVALWFLVIFYHHLLIGSVNKQYILLKMDYNNKFYIVIDKYIVFKDSNLLFYRYAIKYYNTIVQDRFACYIRCF